MIDSFRNQAMSRRSGTSVQVLVATAIVGFFIYLLYSHHDLQTRLKKSEEKAERLHQQHDSLSAQLQVVYEHKTRLERSLQQEKGDHRKTRTELLQQQSEQESKYLGDKQELLNRINSINQEHKMLKSQHEDTQIELTKLNEQRMKDSEDHAKLAEQHNIEFQQLKQEKDNEIAQLRDQIANYQRKNDDVESRLAVAVQNNEINQAQIQRQNELLQGQRQNNQRQDFNLPKQAAMQPDVNLPGNQFNSNNNNNNQQNQFNQQPPRLINYLNQQQPQQQQQQLQQGQPQLLPQNGVQINQQQPLNRDSYGNQQVQQKAPDFVNNNGVQVQDMAINHLNQGNQQQLQQVPQQQMQQPLQNEQNQQQQVQQQQQQQQQPVQHQEQQQPVHQEPDVQHEQMRLDQKNQKQPETGDRGQPGQNLVKDQPPNNQDNIAMQIKQPGDNQHPGYHQVKEVEDNQGRAQHKLVDIREDDAGPVDKVDEEHKDVQFQQVQAPNMSPEKTKEDNNKAMEENDEEENAAKDGNNNNSHLNQDGIEAGAGLQPGRPLENHQEGPMGGVGFDHNAIEAPVQPQMLPRPDEVAPAPDNNFVGGGQMERPNVVPPMVNNVPEDQVPKAPRLKDNEILNKGQQVMDDGDDYGNNNAKNKNVRPAR